MLKKKKKVQEAVKTLAIDLIKLYAERQMQEGFRVSPPDAHYHDFENKFPFEETPDQLKAIDHVLADLSSGKVMDRLICGDVDSAKQKLPFVQHSKWY